MIFKETLPLNVPTNLKSLWQALWERVENPALFLAALESFVIVEKKTDAIYRRLHFPEQIVRDIVRWENEKWLCFDVIPSGKSISGNLKIEILGDEQNGFSICFTYQILDHSSENAHLESYIQSAYHHANLDQMKRLEQLCQPPN